MNKYLKEILENFKEYQIYPVSAFITIPKATKEALRINGILLQKFKNSKILLYNVVKEQEYITDKLSKILSKWKIVYIELNLEYREIRVKNFQGHINFLGEKLSCWRYADPSVFELPKCNAEDFIKSL